MKLLKYEIQGLPLMKETVVVDLYARQQVREDDKPDLYHLTSNLYLNPACAFIGINASGKTTILRVTQLVLDILSNEPVNHCATKDVLFGSDGVELTCYFTLENDQLYKLHAKLIPAASGIGEPYYTFERETLWKKALPEDKPVNKKRLFEFTDRQVVITRDESDAFLSDDVSIMIAVNKKLAKRTPVISLEPLTDFNILAIPSMEIPPELIHFLDDSIERIVVEQKDNNQIFRLKFFGKEERVLSGAGELSHYLSSGTIKGINVFLRAISALQEGGYLLIDEIENHFNTEIVRTLIRFFLEARLNVNGGVLLFTTHYPSLLDEFYRNDCIHITRNEGGLTVQNLMDILSRNDLKKSDAYESSYLGGTAPSYDYYIALKRYIRERVKGGEDV